MPASPAASVAFVNRFDDVDFEWLNWTLKLWFVRPFEMFSEIGAAMVVLLRRPAQAGDHVERLTVVFAVLELAVERDAQSAPAAATRAAAAARASAAASAAATTAAARDRRHAAVPWATDSA